MFAEPCSLTQSVDQADTYNYLSERQCEEKNEVSTIRIGKNANQKKCKRMSTGTLDERFLNSHPDCLVTTGTLGPWGVGILVLSFFWDAPCKEIPASHCRVALRCSHHQLVEFSIIGTLVSILYDISILHVAGALRISPNSWFLETCLHFWI